VHRNSKKWNEENELSSNRLVRFQIRICYIQRFKVNLIDYYMYSKFYVLLNLLFVAFCSTKLCASKTLFEKTLLDKNWFAINLFEKNFVRKKLGSHRWQKFCCCIRASRGRLGVWAGASIQVVPRPETRHRTPEKTDAVQWPILNFNPRGKLWLQGRSCPPGLIFVPWGRSYPLGWNSLFAPPFS
jgi:hypothetical protein